MPNAFNQFAEGYGQGQDMAQGFARQRAGNALAGGDYAGGANALFKSGQIEDGAKLQAIGDDRHTEEVKHRAEFFMKAADVLSQIPDDGTQQHRRAALQRLAPTFQAMGIDPQTVQALQGADLSDQALQAFKGSVAKQFQLVNGANGFVGAFDPAHGSLNVLQKASDRPTTPHWVERKKADGSTEWVDLNEAASAPDTQGGTSVPPSADQTWKAIIQRESGGQPGVTGPQTPYGRAQGMTQMLPQTAQAMAQKLGVAWRPDLMTAKTPEGAAYQEKLGRAYFDEGLQKYGNDPSKAASYYFGGPDEKLWGPKTRAYASAVAPNALQGGAGADTVGGRRAIPGSEAKPGENTAVDPNIVKGLIEGRITPPTQKAAAAPYWQAQLQAATAQDPTFDGVNFQARAKTRADFTSGKSAVNITALNTVVGHLNSLDKAIDGLGNFSGFPGSHLNNQAAQMLAKASGTDTRIRDFETKKEAVANELTRVFRGTGGAEADIQAWKAQLDSTGSPEALRGVVRSMAELINSRLEALGEQYQQGMGTTKDPLTLLTPDKQKAFKRLQGEAQTSPSPSQAPAQQPPAPSGWSVKRLR